MFVKFTNSNDIIFIIDTSTIESVYPMYKPGNHTEPFIYLVSVRGIDRKLALTISQTQQLYQSIDAIDLSRNYLHPNDEDEQSCNAT